MPSSTAPAPSSIATSQLPLSPAEASLLTHNQSVALALAQTQPADAYEPRLLIDPTSLTLLSSHLDRLLHSIAGRLDDLSAQAQADAMQQQFRVSASIDAADREIARFKAILAQIDDLEMEFEKIQRIGDIVKGFRGRVERLEAKFA